MKAAHMEKDPQLVMLCWQEARRARSLPTEDGSSVSPVPNISCIPVFLDKKYTRFFFLMFTDEEQVPVLVFHALPGPLHVV